MKNFFSKYKGALGLLVLILVGFWAYATYFDQAEQLFQERPEVVGEELFEFLAVLEGISLDGAIFSNPDFLALQDFETQVPSGRAGRANPFAPAGGDTGGVVVEPSYTVIPVSSAESFLNTPTTTGDTQDNQSTGTTTPVAQ